MILITLMTDDFDDFDDSDDSDDFDDFLMTFCWLWNFHKIAQKNEVCICLIS